MKRKNEDFAKQNRSQFFIFHYSIFIIHYIFWYGGGLSPAVFYAIRLHFSCHPVGAFCERPFFIQTNILCVILSERSESNFCEVQRSKRAKAQGEAVAGSIMRFRWLFQTNVTFFQEKTTKFVSRSLRRSRSSVCSVRFTHYTNFDSTSFRSG